MRENSRLLIHSSVAIRFRKPCKDRRKTYQQEHLDVFSIGTPRVSPLARKPVLHRTVAAFIKSHRLTPGCDTAILSNPQIGGSDTMPGVRCRGLDPKSLHVGYVLKSGYAGSSVMAVEGVRVRAIDGIRRGIEASGTWSR